MPVIATIALLLIVVMGTAMLASNTLADLVGLIYLLVSPVIYRFLNASTGLIGTNSEGSTGRLGSGNSG